MDGDHQLNDVICVPGVAEWQHMLVGTELVTGIRNEQQS